MLTIDAIFILLDISSCIVRAHGKFLTSYSYSKLNATGFVSWDWIGIP